LQFGNLGVKRGAHAERLDGLRLLTRRAQGDAARVGLEGLRFGLRG
jgi:hypothetical protein